MNYLSTHKSLISQIAELTLLSISLFITIEFGPDWVEFFEEGVGTAYKEFNAWLSWKYEPSIDLY